LLVYPSSIINQQHGCRDMPDPSRPEQRGVAILVIYVKRSSLRNILIGKYVIVYYDNSSAYCILIAYTQRWARNGTIAT